MANSSILSEQDTRYLERCVELARTALEAGDAPFGSILVDAHGNVLKEDRNRTITETNVTLHPELSLAVWAQKNLDPAARQSSTVYTSGEHCPMCSAAHGSAGLGKIVYASSSEQLVEWREKLGVEGGPVLPLAINKIVPSLEVAGPHPELSKKIFEMHTLKQQREQGKS